MIPFNIIVAVDEEFGIGKEGGLPWHLPGDMKFFKEITTKTEDAQKKNVVIMGRKTWESIPARFRPLPGRINCVLSRNKDFPLPDDVLRAESLEAALKALGGEARESIDKVFIIGGAQIFLLALRMLECQKIYMTQIALDFQCDSFFPSDLTGFEKISDYRDRSIFLWLGC